MSDIVEIASVLSENGHAWRLGSAFRCQFAYSPPLWRLAPADFLALKANGLVEPYDGTNPRLTPLGEQVRAHLLATPGDRP